MLWKLTVETRVVLLVDSFVLGTPFMLESVIEMLISGLWAIFVKKLYPCGTLKRKQAVDYTHRETQTDTHKHDQFQAIALDTSPLINTGQKMHQISPPIQEQTRLPPPGCNILNRYNYEGGFVRLETLARPDCALGHCKREQLISLDLNSGCRVSVYNVTRKIYA